MIKDCIAIDLFVRCKQPYERSNTHISNNNFCF